MTKKELMQKYEDLTNLKQIKLEGIGWHLNKQEIQNAIDCLECPDALLDQYFVVLNLKYANIGKVISDQGDFKNHRFNRLYVYNTARQILA